MALYGTPISTIRGPYRAFSTEYVIAAWVRLDSAPSVGRLSDINFGSGGNGGGRIGVEHTSFTSRLMFIAGPGDPKYKDFVAPVAGVWTHLLFRRYYHSTYGWVMDGYSNGVYTGGASAPLSASPTVPQLEVRGFYGAICDVCVWYGYFTPDMNAILNNRMSAAMQFRHGLIEHFPLIRDPSSTRGTHSIVLTGTNLGYVDHPIRIHSK